MAVAMTTREDACEHCSARGSCEALGGTGENVEVRALNTAEARIGDRVTIAMASTSFLKASFLIYTLPILALIGGILLGFLINRLFGINENLAVGGSSGLALVLVFFWLRKKAKELGQKKEFIPEIVATVQKSGNLSPTPGTCPAKQ